MITKKRLLAGLSELIYVEEGMVGLYANFSKTLIKQAEDLEEDKKKEITKLVSVLYYDSSRHKEDLDGMMKQIRKGDRDEY